MTNKDYDRLTDTGIPTTTPEDVYNRLRELENAIENGTLVFLPCKVGDEFWYINKLWKIAGRQEVAKFEVGDYEICIVDTFEQRYSVKDFYFTKKAAEKALKELK